MHNLIHKYGATIYYNGWANVARRPMLELMFACPSGDVFIGSFLLARYSETIGIDNIIQI
jgi:hypothetical protein